MISQVTFKSAVISSGYRILKVLGYGNSPLTADECAPFGLDSSPVQNLIAVYSETEEAGDRIIVGYFNQDVLAQPGETRLFSVNPADGTLSTYAWLKTDGTMALGGTGDKLVRYAPLLAGINAKDTLINAELLKISVAIAALGGAYAQGNISTNITGSKIETIDCAGA
jgi:hypothetical protein